MSTPDRPAEIDPAPARKPRGRLYLIFGAVALFLVIVILAGTSAAQRRTEADNAFAGNLYSLEEARTVLLNDTSAQQYGLTIDTSEVQELGLMDYFDVLNEGLDAVDAQSEQVLVAEPERCASSGGSMVIDEGDISTYEGNTVIYGLVATGATGQRFTQAVRHFPDQDEAIDFLDRLRDYYKDCSDFILVDALGEGVAASISSEVLTPFIDEAVVVNSTDSTSTGADRRLWARDGNVVLWEYAYDSPDANTTQMMENVVLNTFETLRSGTKE
jgi:hypothetical protein